MKYHSWNISTTVYLKNNEHKNNDLAIKTFAALRLTSQNSKARLKSDLHGRSPSPTRVDLSQINYAPGISPSDKHCTNDNPLMHLIEGIPVKNHISIIKDFDHSKNASFERNSRWSLIYHVFYNTLCLNQMFSWMQYKHWKILHTLHMWTSISQDILDEFMIIIQKNLDNQKSNTLQTFNNKAVWLQHIRSKDQIGIRNKLSSRHKV